jgi:serine/threonine-protein kinase
MGSVWRAEDRVLRIEVAVKLIDPMLVDSSTAMARFEQEAHAAARLRSTHIVHINDYGVDAASGQPFIVMDLLEGESLQQRLEREGKLAFPEVQRMLAEVARGLALAHAKGIAHRDLKPENIFIAREGGAEIVKVLDFGIAKRFDKMHVTSALRTGDGQMLGTPYYMSPEQARAMSNVDHRTDVWAFGVIAFECLTGSRPFESDNIPSLILKICDGEIVDPSDFAAVPVGFTTWFARAVERSVEHRFQTILEASSALEALLNAPLERRGVADTAAKTLAATVATARTASTTRSGTAAFGVAGKQRVVVWSLGVIAAIVVLTTYVLVARLGEKQALLREQAPATAVMVPSAQPPGSAVPTESQVSVSQFAESVSGTTNPSIHPAAARKSKADTVNASSVPEKTAPKANRTRPRPAATTNSPQSSTLDPGI